jgi:hypothetical protein
MIDEVIEFMRTKGQQIGRPIGPERNARLVVWSADAARLARELDHAWGSSGDLRFLRCHLIVEELSELMIALGETDRVATLDALCDLAYVVVGCAVAFGLPLDEGFREVHRSNMSKAMGDQRGRDKGPAWSPPDLDGVLRRCEL